MPATDSHIAQLSAGLRSLGIALDAARQRTLLAYLEELALWNRAYNLTAVREFEQMIARHLLDSLALLPWLPAGKLVDVGSGAGLPGIPLAIASTRVQFDLLDANGKKARFMRHALRALNLSNARVVESRLEDFRPEVPYAAVTARAFAPLPRLAAGVRHLLGPGGRLLAMQAEDAGAPDPAPEGYLLADTVALDVPGCPKRQLTILEVV